tara:strand:- start:155 stop:490 length:336 start_codon:yes stop_codon:yes gene_type:complete
VAALINGMWANSVCPTASRPWPESGLASATTDFVVFVLRSPRHEEEFLAEILIVEGLIKKLFFAIVVGLYALVTGADRQFAGGYGGGFNKFFAPTITLNEIKIECASPDVA